MLFRSEVSLVVILDADKEGFLRSTRALVQTIGRAARNENGRVLLYADKITDSMKNAMDETERRRVIQQAYNKEHGITPQTIRKEVRDLIRITSSAEEEIEITSDTMSKLKPAERRELLETMELEMRQAAKELDFEKAASLRDVMLELRAKYK